MNDRPWKFNNNELTSSLETWIKLSKEVEKNEKIAPDQKQLNDIKDLLGRIKDQITNLEASLPRPLDRLGSDEPSDQTAPTPPPS